MFAKVGAGYETKSSAVSAMFAEVGARYETSMNVSSDPSGFAVHESSCHEIVASTSDWLKRCELIPILARPSFPSKRPGRNRDGLASHTNTVYRIAGKFGGGFDLAVWRFSENPSN